MTDATKRLVVSDFGSPYYLHPSDHPSLTICSVSLKGENYQEWYTAMTNAFKAKQKLRFIDGTISAPTTNSLDMTAWTMVNFMLIGWTIQTIDPYLRSSITYFNTIREIWDDLRQRFSVGNDARKAQLLVEIATFCQSRQSISAFYNALKKLWDKLTTYAPYKLCACGSYKCGLNASLIAEREEERIHQFLIGLDDTVFGALCSNLLSQDPLPPMNRVYALVVQEERLKSMASSREPSATNNAFFGHQLPPLSKDAPPVDRKSLTCTHCGKKGHNINTCFKIHGIPNSLKEKLVAR